jgi:hypothetical protein
MTMSITMIQTRMGESGSLLNAGSTYVVSDAFGAAMVGARYATDTYGVLNPQNPGSVRMSLYATLALTATSSGKRQALGSTVTLRFTAGGAGSIYARFSNASGAIAVSSGDTVIDCNATTPVTLNVPSGYPFIEYLRVGGSDVTFNLGLMV